LAGRWLVLKSTRGLTLTLKIFQRVSYEMGLIVLCLPVGYVCMVILVPLAATIFSKEYIISQQWAVPFVFLIISVLLYLTLWIVRLGRRES
jgi:hypothetical protein